MTDIVCQLGSKHYCNDPTPLEKPRESSKRRYDYFLAEGGHVRVEMQNNMGRIDRFIEAFEKLYGRKPKAEDADSDFTVQVAQDMQMSVGGARYYIRLASVRKAEEK